MPVDEVVAALSVRERVLLFCIASATDWLLARITEETVIAMLVTLANMRSLGVRSLAVSCMLCHHEARLGVDGYADDATVQAERPGLTGTQWRN
jgi:hypothetical protein